MTDVHLEARIHVIEMLVFALIRASASGVRAKIAAVMRSQIDTPTNAVMPPGLSEAEQQTFHDIITTRINAILGLLNQPQA